MPVITPQTFPLGKARKKFQSSEKLYKTKKKLFISLIYFTSASNASFELQTLFSTFGVVRNEFVKKILKQSNRSLRNDVIIWPVQSFCPFITRTSGGSLVNRDLKIEVIRHFREPRTSRSHVTTSLASGLQFEVHVFTARPRSRGK